MTATSESVASHVCVLAVLDFLRDVGAVRKLVFLRPSAVQPRGSYRSGLA